MSDTIFRGERLINSGTQSSPRNLGKSHHLPFPPPRKQPASERKLEWAKLSCAMGGSGGAPRAGAARGPSQRGGSPAGHVGLHSCLKGWVFTLPRALPFPKGQGRSRARVWWEFSPRSRTERSPLRTRGAASAAASRPPRLKPGTAGWLPPLPGLFSSRKTRVVPRCLLCPRGQERGSPGRPPPRPGRWSGGRQSPAVPG